MPTVTCLHDSCREEVAKVNGEIRSAWTLFQPPIDEATLAIAREKARVRYALEEKARASLPEILKTYKWDVSDIDMNCSDNGDTDTLALFLEMMFQAEDVIWIGEPESSGSERFKSNFSYRVSHQVGQFMGLTLGHYTCASTFKPGVYSRKNENVLTTPYMIVEGDKVLGQEPKTNEEKLANKNACGAIFKWLQMGLGLRLRAVVDSGNKSLHGWFTYPAAGTFDELKVVLPAMGCDPAMFKPTQPARLPGVIRDNGNPQRLLWIN